MSYANEQNLPKIVQWKAPCVWPLIDKCARVVLNRQNERKKQLDLTLWLRLVEKTKEEKEKSTSSG